MDARLTMAGARAVVSAPVMAVSAHALKDTTLAVSIEPGVLVSIM